MRKLIKQYEPEIAAAIAFPFVYGLIYLAMGLA
jgi:hypothetical protein